MGNIVGIDLGTTNSVAAFKWAEVQVVTATDNTPPDRKLTRSVVALDNGQVVVGEKAYRQLRQDPENVIISIKRLMGRGFGDEVVQKYKSNYTYKITQATLGTENSLSVWLGNKEYAPEDLSAEILKKVVQNAQKYQEEQGQKEKITQAVITVPAYFNDKQRYATQIAAIKAGLAQPELLPEPTAAAISYGFKPDADDVKTILVYDFGGGTFDSSLITASGNQFIESGKAGDLWLGGDDIDGKIIEFVKQKVAEEEGLEDINALIAQMPHYEKIRFLGDLKMCVERAKIDLSSNSKATIITDTRLLDELGMAIDIDVTITRDEFEAMILPLVERSVAIAQDAIKYSEYPTDMIDVVLLVGGSSQIPLVQQKVREAFGADKVVIHPRPMYAVAEGAAIVSAGLTEKVGTVSRDYFIELVDNPKYPIIKQGEILPVTNSHTFKTEADGQSLIHFKFCNPDQVNEGSDDSKWDLWLALNKSYPKGTEVLLTVELDEKNTSLQITAALKNDPSIRVSGSFSRGGVDERISRQVEQTIQQLNEEGKLTDVGVKYAYELAGQVVMAANQIHQNGEIKTDRIEEAQAKLKEFEALASNDKHLAEIYARDFEFVIKNCQMLIPESQQTRIKKLIQELKFAISANNVSGIQKLTEDAQQELNNLPQLVIVILLSKDAIGKAYQIAPTHARAMEIKFSKMLDALQVGNGAEAERLLSELLPDVRQYLDEELPTGNIATGLTL